MFPSTVVDSKETEIYNRSTCCCHLGACQGDINIFVHFSKFKVPQKGTSFLLSPWLARKWQHDCKYSNLIILSHLKSQIGLLLLQLYSFCQSVTTYTEKNFLQFWKQITRAWKYFWEILNRSKIDSRMIFERSKIDFRMIFQDLLDLWELWDLRF